jgi:tetratricopeptide (TPR) repeat protein
LNHQNFIKMKLNISVSIVLLIAGIALLSCQQKQSLENGVGTSNLEYDSAVAATAELLGKDSSEINFIWYGRRLGYANRMTEAIDIFSSGIERHPESWKLYRFRGHRYISVRNFEAAIIDLETAVKKMENDTLEIEPDGIPNKINTPLSTYQFNVWYHLGLAYYLTDQLPLAEKAFKNCMLISDNDDLLVAASDWLYMIYRQQNNVVDAAEILKRINDNLRIIENDSYYLRLRMYQGKIEPEKLLSSDSTASDYDLNLATQGYGVGNWYFYNGDTSRAKEIFQKVVSGKSNYSFGFIAAENMLSKQFGINPAGR